MYRQGVGIVIVNDKNQVLMFKRDKKTNIFKEHDQEHILQFPQGGMNLEEDEENAVRRELYEETGIRSIQILGSTKTKIKYKFPHPIILDDNKLFEGQEQRWFLAKMIKQDEIKFDIDENKIEFCEYKWIDIDDVINYVVSFKRDLYQQILKEFFNV